VTAEEREGGQATATEEVEAPDDPVTRRAPFAANPSVGARGQQARQKILDAAVQVFGELGYHGCRISRITELTGLSRVSFYQYFSSKQDLFRQLAATVAHELTASIDELEPIGPGADGWQVLHDWMDRFSAIYDEFEPVFVTFQSAAESDTEIWGRATRVGERTNQGLQSKIVGSSLTKGQRGAVVATIFEAVMRGNRRSAIAEAEWPETMGDRRAGLNIAFADVFHRTLFGVDPDVNVHLQQHPRRARPAAKAAADVGLDDPSLSPAARRTRDRLLETSHTVFAERGFHATRVDDIVAAAGVSHGSFYRYFDSKHQVFGLLATRAGARMAACYAELAGLEAPRPGSTDHDGEFTAWLERYGQRYAEEGPIISTWVEAMSRTGNLDELSRDALEASHHAISSFLSARDFGDVASEAVAMMEILDAFCASPPTPKRVSFYRWLIERGLLTAPG
jgi:AcrR family transcriptional regulator